MSRITRIVTGLAALIAAAALTGCQCVDQKPAPAAKAAPAKPVGMVKAQTAFPSCDQASSAILLEKEAPAEVNVGESFKFYLKATNLTSCQLLDVVVTDKLPTTFEIQGSDPKAVVQGNLAQWQLGTLAPKETKTITVQGQAREAGELTNCAAVDYKLNVCIPIRVVSPKLALTTSTPDHVLICDSIPVKLQVCNTGTGAISNVVVTDTLPEGLVTADGKNTVTFDAGTLAAGACRDFTYMAKATKTGAYKHNATAQAGSLKADASSGVAVHQPVLAITKDGTKTQFAGRDIDYTITVTNSGDAAANGLTIVDSIPAGTTFVSATQGGTFAAGKVTWSVASLAPNAKATVGVKLASAAIGTLKNDVVAEAACAKPVSASVETLVKGIPAVLLEVIDVSDPIEVGKEETYVVTVTNQGSIPDTNIKIVCTLEDAQQYVSSSGVTQGTAAGQVVTFAPLASLGAKARAEWKVVVKAAKAGDIRFTTSMTSDQLTRPVQETEATNQY